MALKSKQIQQAQRITIFDTTLRDGEQTPGIAWTFQQKLDIARKLDSLGVDVMEVGFLHPKAVDDIHLVQTLTNERTRAEICALARLRSDDIETVAKSGAKRINFFIPVSGIQANAMGMDLGKIEQLAVEATRMAREKRLKVEFTLMDAARAKPDFLAGLAIKLEKAGVNILTLSDTVGSRNPTGTYKLFAELRKKVRLPLSVHVHNDRGLATANSLAAVEGGATQVHVTVGGLGDRAGNASLEEVVIGLKDFYGKRTRIKVRKLTEIIKSIAKIGKFSIHPSKPIVGARAFAHSSGIHAAALNGFEPFNPVRVGAKREILYGKGSGKAAVEALVKRLHIELTSAQIDALVAKLKSSGSMGKVHREQAVARAMKLGPKFRAASARGASYSRRT